MRKIVDNVVKKSLVYGDPLLSDPLYSGKVLGFYDDINIEEPIDTFDVTKLFTDDVTLAMSAKELGLSDEASKAVTATLPADEANTLLTLMTKYRSKNINVTIARAIYVMVFFRAKCLGKDVDTFDEESNVFNDLYSKVISLYPEARIKKELVIKLYKLYIKSYSASAKAETDLKLAADMAGD